MRHVITEKDERTKAVEALASQFRGLQDQVTELSEAMRHTREEPRREPEAAAPAPRPHEEKSLGPQADMMRSELMSQKTELSSCRRGLEQSFEALRASVQKVEQDLKEARAKSVAMTSSLKTELDELRCKLPGAAFAKVPAVSEPAPAIEAQVNSVPETAIMAGRLTPAELGQGGADSDPMRTFGRQFKALDERVQQQAQDVGSIRLVLIEVHVSLLQHALRASRIALRSTELSREERRLALTSLDSKETQIKSEVAALREKGDCPVNTLTSIHKVALEQVF